MSGFFTAESLPSDGSYVVTNFSVTVQGQNYTNAGPFSGVQITNGTPGQDRFDLTVPTLTGAIYRRRPRGWDRSPAIFSWNFLHSRYKCLGFQCIANDHAQYLLFDHKTEWRLNFTPGLLGGYHVLTAVPATTAVLLFGCMG